MKKLLLLLLLLFYSVAFGQLTPHQKPLLGMQINYGHPLAKGLVGCWIMNEDDGDKIYDLSGNNNHGTLEGNVSWIAGKYGSALDFNPGSDYVNLGTLPQISSEFTLIISAKSTGPGSYNGNDGYFLSDSNDVTNFYFRRANGGTNQLYLGIGDQSHPITGTYLVDQWNVYAITHNSSGTVNFYHNGDFIEEAISGSNFAGFNNNAYLGNRAALDRDFDGQIGHVFISNRVLSASEIQQLYSDPFCMFAPPFKLSLFKAIMIIGGQVIIIGF
jgi:hypothetical protein